MKLSQKVAALLAYIEYNNQVIYTKSEKSGYEAKKELTAIAADLANGTEVTNEALLVRYRKAVNHLVQNYFSTEKISPLMYATKGSQLGLMKDILATPKMNIDEPFAQRVKIQTRQYLFGNYEWIEKNGPDNGYTALVYAARNKKMDAYNLLLRHYANPHQVLNSESERTVSDIFNHDEELNIYLILENAYLQQAIHLVEDLIACTTQEQFDAIIEIQTRLGIGKPPVIDALINFNSDDQSKQIKLLEQATDINELNEAQNFVAEYVKKASGMISRTDDDSLKIVKNKLDALTAVKKPVIEAEKTSSASEKPLIVTWKYGPQNPVNPMNNEIHPAYRSGAYNASL